MSRKLGTYHIEVKGKLMLPLFAHSRHIALPPVFVYGFGAIFGKITAIEPLKISRSISDRVDCPPIRLSCFGIISVSVRQFSPVSFLPWISQRRIAPFGTLVSVRVPPYPCQKSWRYIAREAYPTQAGHSIGIIHRWTTCIIEHFCALCRMSTK